MLQRFESFLPATSRGAFLLTSAATFALGLSIALFIAPRLGYYGEFAGLQYDGYWELGSNLIRGNGYVLEPGGPIVFHRPPLAPILFAPLSLLPGGLQQPVLTLVQSLMLGLAFALVFDLAKRVFGLRAARWSLVMMLGYPWVYWHAKNPTNIPLQTVCVAIVFYLLGRELLLIREGDAGRNPPVPWRKALLLGLATAGAIFTHGTMLLTVPMLLGAAALLGIWMGSFRLLKVATAAGLIAAVTVLPWTYRNWCATGRFMPVVGGAGLQYFFGHIHWGFDGRKDSRKFWKRLAHVAIPDCMEANGDKPIEPFHYCGFTHPDFEAEANRRMVEDICNRPGRFAKRVLLNSVEFYLPSVRDFLMPKTITPLGAPMRAAHTVWHFGTLCLVGMALWRTRRSNASTAGWLALAAIAILASAYMPFVATIFCCQYVLQTVPLLAFAFAALFATAPPPPVDTATRPAVGQQSRKRLAARRHHRLHEHSAG